MVCGLPQEISLIEQRTRLTLCQGDTIYHGVISERPKGDEEETGACGNLETPAKSASNEEFLCFFFVCLRVQEKAEGTKPTGLKSK